VPSLRVRGVRVHLRLDFRVADREAQAAGFGHGGPLIDQLPQDLLLDVHGEESRIIARRRRRLTGFSVHAP